MLSFVTWKFGEEPTEHIKYIKSHWENLESHTRGFYTNDLFEEDQAAVDANYRGNYGGLLKIKNEYAPTNLLRLNANIVPTV